MTQQRGYTEAGWHPGGFSNRYAGAATVLPIGWRQEHVRRVELPPPPLPGRGIAIDAGKGGWKMFVAVAVLYFPPRPCSAVGLRQYVACCKELSQWTIRLLKKLPAR
eukprot:7644854-Pyramimonas_sp.AAC.1